MFQNNPRRMSTMTGANCILTAVLLMTFIVVAVAPDAWGQYQVKKPVGTLAPASITVTGPATGDKWERGQRYDVTWESKGVRGSVKIELIDPNGKATTLVPQTANNGKYTFALMPGVKDGDYKIRVSSVDGKTLGETSGIIHVGNFKGAVQKTAVTGTYQPAGGTGNTYQPRGTVQETGAQAVTGVVGTVGGTYDEADQLAVEGGVSNAGSATVGTEDRDFGVAGSGQAVANAGMTHAVSEDVLLANVQGGAGEMTTLVIPDSDVTEAMKEEATGGVAGMMGAIAGASQGVDAPDEGNISLITPTGGEVWETEQLQTISWEGPNATNATVKLLIDGSGPVVLSNSSGNANSVGFTPQPRFSTGLNRFKIQVTKLGEDLRVTSPEPFSIWSGVPVDLKAGIRNFGGGVEKDERGFFKSSRYTRYVEFEAWVINAGAQFLQYVPIVVRVTKYPENLQLERFEAGFSPIDPRVWIKTQEPIKFDIETWKGYHKDVNVMWEAGTYEIELEVDPFNTLGEPETYRADNKVKITFVRE